MPVSTSERAPNELEVTLLGTGTSQGVPVIGCPCPVCHSADPRDQRLRTAALLRFGQQAIAIDCGPDFRQQMLRSKVQSLDAILFTHEHNDHIIGLDDVRPFNFQRRADMPVYCTPQVGRELRQRFAYVFALENRYPGAPMVHQHFISKDAPFEVCGLEIVPVEVLHGTLPVLGFRIGDFAYLTDVKTISKPELDKVLGVRYLVLNALHHKAHITHLNLEEALALIERIQPEQAFLTHISHSMGRYAEMQPLLPPNVALGYDGLSFKAAY
jgi:phosphoribosyl 1,2-cyclic phosphate phosphodiesterase